MFSTETPFSITIANVPVDVLALPDASLRAMLSRGLTHYFGSEVASKVKAWADGVLEETKTAVTDDERTAKKGELVEAALSRLLEGTVGNRTVGVQIDPIEKIINRLARKSVEDTLRANGLKVPKKDEAVTFANGTSKSMADMIATRMTATNKATGKVYGDEFKAEAAKLLKAQQTAKAKAEALASEVGDDKTADALGL